MHGRKNTKKQKHKEGGKNTPSTIICDAREGAPIGAGKLMRTRVKETHRCDLSSCFPAVLVMFKCLREAWLQISDGRFIRS